MSVITNHANALYEALKSGTPIAPLRDSIQNDIPTAYAIQQALVERRLADGERIVGKKIGLTSPAVQAQLGVDQPDYGVLFHTMDVSSSGRLSVSEVLQPKAEGELAFVLGKDLIGPKISMEELKNAIAAVHASIEIVGSRVSNWDIKISDTIADNASGSHFILGKEGKVLNEVPTAQVEMKLYKNGALVSEGSGAACMGDPLNAALWLANTMAKGGRPLKAGEILLSGALGPMVPVSSGDAFKVEIQGFEPVEILFTA
ncbi:MAG: hypothetical protein RLZZ599_759 [Bacteroidota bacterium]|jgi:2-keto-4-pentenoate hydratase